MVHDQTIIRTLNSGRSIASRATTQQLQRNTGWTLMTITESVHSILASDAEPIRMYKWSGSAPARGIIQIAHGMGEHALRYRPIAHALVSAGYTVYANDHRGHGEFAAQANVLGDFGPGGFPVLVDDMAKVTQAARDADKGKPLVLRGHSMGSFAAQLYF